MRKNHYIVLWSLTLAGSASVLGCGGAEPTSVDEAAAESAAYTLRGDVLLRLRPGTALDAEELAARGSYGATLFDPSGMRWFVRVEQASIEELGTFGLRTALVEGDAIHLGAAPDGAGSDVCHVLRSIDDGRFVALSRPADERACPVEADEVAGWLPAAEPVASIADDRIGVAQQALAFGTEIGRFNGIIAYANGSTGHNSGLYSCCGLKWQCVEYVNRYYNQALGHRNLIRTGHAYSYFSTAGDKGLTAYANSGAVRPEVGDMLTSAGGSFGHVAIVREVGSNYVTVIQQNWFNDTRDNAMRLSMTVSGGRYQVAGFSGSYPVQGWLRKPVVTSVTPSSARFGYRTSFTVTGSGLPTTLAAWIGECASLTVDSVTPTRAQFSCTPSYSRGVKSGVVKHRSGGDTLRDFAVSVY